MCNPIAILGVATVASVGSQLYSARQQRKASEQQAAADADYMLADSAAQARMMNTQADQLDRQAEQIRASADISVGQINDEALQRAKMIRKAANEVRSTTKAAFAGAGVRVGEGSSMLADEDIVFDSEQDAAMQILTGNRQAAAIERDAEQDIQSAKNSATNLRTAAAEDSALARQAATATINQGRTTARQYTTSGWLNAGNTVLGAAASYGRWTSLMSGGKP